MIFLRCQGKRLGGGNLRCGEGHRKKRSEGTMVRKGLRNIALRDLFSGCFFLGGGGKANGGRDLGKATACSSLGFPPSLALGNHAMMEI